LLPFNYGKLPPGAQAELNALLEKPPVSETLDFGASICGIALISLLLMQCCAENDAAQLAGEPNRRTGESKTPS
jgi:hypothetical protein